MNIKVFSIFHYYNITKQNQIFILKF